MATRTKAATSKQKSSAKKLSNHFGTYTVARGHVSISVPPFWTFRQTNEDIEVDSPSGDTSIIVTAYKRNARVNSLDAREYLEHFLASAPRESRVQRDQESKKTKATAKYRDSEGNSWFVQFVTNGHTLLLAELSTAGSLSSREAKTALAVLESLKLKRQ